MQKTALELSSKSIASLAGLASVQEDSLHVQLAEAACAPIVEQCAEGGIQLLVHDVKSSTSWPERGAVCVMMPSGCTMQATCAGNRLLQCNLRGSFSNLHDSDSAIRQVPDHPAQAPCLDVPAHPKLPVTLPSLPFDAAFGHLPCHCCCAWQGP